MKKHLVLVGCGHAHLTTMVRVRDYIERGHRVTLISPTPYHYYSGMGPGLLSGMYRPEDIRFHVKKMAEDRGAAFLEGNVIRVDPRTRILFLDSGNQVDYDVVSFNVGSFVPLESVEVGHDEKVFTVKPINNLLHARRAALDLIQRGTPRFLIAGGGAAGLEISGNLHRLVHDHRGNAHITLLAGRRLLDGLPEKARVLARRSLADRGITVMEGVALSRFENGEAVLSDARNMPYELMLLALGVKPSRLFLDSGLPTGEDGGLLVDASLKSVAYPQIFGGGDCISLEGRQMKRVGVHAVRQNQIIYHNLMAALEGGQLRSFDPGRPYLLIYNLGDGRGIFVRNNWVWDGRLSFYLKDFIDRRFMRTFQVSGEREEHDTDM